MRPFAYLRLTSVEEVCRLLAEHGEGAKLIAGGQSLIPMLKQRIMVPDYIIDLKYISELDYIIEDGEGIRIGALATHRDVETSPLIRERFPVLVEMERWLAQPQIKNWGTLVGNLAHADPGGDPAPPLIALGARVKAVSQRGERVINLEDFFEDYLTTVLEPDELLVEVQISNPPDSSGAAYRKETIRAGDNPIGAVAAMVRLEGKKVREACIILGGVGSTPIKAEKASKLLSGASLDDLPLNEAARAAAEEADPSSDLEGSAEYKRRIVYVLTREIVSRAVERASAKGGGPR